MSFNEAYGCPTASNEASSPGYLMHFNEAYGCPSAPVTNDNHSMPIPQQEASAPQHIPNAVCGATADDGGGYVVNQLLYEEVQSPHSQDTQ